MAETSGIGWTDATVNFWWGCTKVGPGCDHCYAEKWNGFRGNKQWGPGAPRRWIKGSTALIRKLQRGHDAFLAEHMRHRRVFMHSMSDFFDNEVDPNWRAQALCEIEEAPDLDIQIVTKRVSNVEKMMPPRMLAFWPRHIGLMITVCNQAEWNRDVPRLCALKAKFDIPWIGISMEPMLGPIHTRCAPITDELRRAASFAGKDEFFDPCHPRLRYSIDWIIVGGESGRDARPMHPEWVRKVRDSLRVFDSSAKFFFKQWGEWAPISQVETEAYESLYVSNRRAREGEDQNALDEIYGRRCTVEKLCLHVDGNHAPIAAPNAWDRSASPMLAFKAGKKRSGDMLDGKHHRDFPTFGRSGPVIGVDLAKEAGGGSMGFVNGGRVR